MKITTDNYEAYLLQYMEHLLNDAERAEVEVFLSQHPDLKKEMEQCYDPTLVITAPTATMPNKEQLKHKTVAFTSAWRYAVAACLIGAVACTVVARWLQSSPTDNSTQPAITVAQVQPQAMPKASSAAVEEPITVTLPQRHTTPTIAEAAPTIAVVETPIEESIIASPEMEAESDTEVADTTPDTLPTAMEVDYLITYIDETTATEISATHYATTPTVEVDYLISYTQEPEPPIWIVTLMEPYITKFEQRISTIEYSMIAFVERIKNISTDNE